MDKLQKKTQQDSAEKFEKNQIIGKPKEKRRSNEKRKEKSRDAARCRRSRETEIFTELANVIPVRREDIEQLDKASVMRLAIAFLKVRDVLKLFPIVKNLTALKDTKESIKGDEKKPLDLMWNNEETTKFLSQTLDGFLLILSSDGDVTYASESISEILGIAQIDILGQQVWEFIHQCDHDELKEALNMRKNNLLNDDNKSDENDHLKTAHRDLFLRFKCTLTSRGRSVNIKSASYKVIHLTGHLIMNAEGEKILIGVGRLLPHPSNIEIPLGTTTFLTKHSLDMKFTYVDDKLNSLLKYNQEDLLGKSLYNCHYASDSESLMGTFKTVISKGQGETCRYRFLGKYGGYCWLVTQATVVYEKQKPQSVVCVNYVISNLENENEIYSCEQLESTNIIKQEKEENIQQKQIEINENKLKNNNVDNNNLIDENDNKNICELNNKILNCNNNNNNNNNSDDILKKNIKLSQNRESSLSPIRRTFTNKCSISQQDGLLHQQKINNNNNYLSNIITTPISFGQKLNINNNNNKIILEKRPKSVTASVFTQKRLPTFPSSIVTTPTTLNAVTNTNSIISGRNTILLDINNLSQINCAPRAQSVTASIFKPISQIDNNSCSGIGSGNNNNNNNNNISAFGVINNQIKTQIFSPIPQLQNLQNQTELQEVEEEEEEEEEEQLQTEEQQRTEDMNKGFLSFAEDTPDLTMLKEEPDDLTHLAPTAGDSCIQLDEPTPLFGEMLESLILPDAYCSLLPDDINSLDSQHSENSTSNNNSTNNQNNNNNNNNNKVSIDPFINYRDESSDTNSSPHLLSPGSLTKNPEVSSLPSLCSPHSMNQDDEFAFMTMNVDDDIDLTMRAPYIPMNEQDDLPLLTDDLMWSAFSEELSLHKDMKDVIQMHEIAIKNHHNNCYNSISTNKTEVTSTTTNRINNNNSNNNNNNDNNNNINNNSSNNLTNNQHNSNSNSDLLNNESNLSQILCGNTINDENTLNSLHQNDINYKKRKFIDDDDSFNDTIDAFGQVFNNKNSSNLDCWTMNDLLQLNQENNKQQNLLIQTSTENISTTSTTPPPPPPTKSTTGTLHVPLITIENNQKMNNALNTRLNLTTINNNNNNNKNNIKNNNCNNIKDENNSKINLNNNSNFITTIKRLTECNSTSTTLQNNLNGGIIGGSCIRSQDVNSCHNNNNNNNNNKRHLSGTSSLDSKRVKNNNSLLSSSSLSPSSSSSSTNVGSNQIATLSIENKTPPNLLQTPQQQRQQQQQQKSQKYLSSSYDNNKLNKWGGSEGQQHQQQQQQQQQQQPQQNHQQQQQLQQSNSVLKNLLVSGCDATSPLPAIITEDCSNEQIIQPMTYNSHLLSPCSPTFYNDNAISNHSIAFLRHSCTNPMIGGTGLLLSPTIIPQINSPVSNDTSCDSGIECNHVKKSVNFIDYKNHIPSNDKTINNNNNNGFYTTKLTISPNQKNDYIIKSSEMKIITPLINNNMPSVTVFQQQNQIQQLPLNESVEFMNTDNPFESQLLMDLCNDDYNMDTNIEDDFLNGENVLSKDFNDWTANVI